MNLIQLLHFDLLSQLIYLKAYGHPFVHNKHEVNLPMAWRRAFVILTSKFSATNLKLEKLINRLAINQWKREFIVT